MKDNIFIEENVKEQVSVVENIIKYYSTDYENKLSEARKIIASKKIVIFTGMATSLYAADLAAIIMSESGYCVFTEDASELLHYKDKMLTEDAVLVAVSQSGETAETRKVIENTRMPIISVTNNENSTIARMSDLNLPILAGEEKGSAGKTYIATLVLMLALGYYCTGKDSYFFKYINRVVPLMKEVTSYFEDNISDLVNYFDDNQEYIFFIGRGPNVITAQQSALNTKELARVYAEGMGAGAFQHGPYELADSNLTAVFFAPESECQSLTINMALKTLKTGAKVWIISDKKGLDLIDSEKPGLYISELPVMPEIFTPLLTIIPTEFFGVELGLRRGLTPGILRNIGKVTKEE